MLLNRDDVFDLLRCPKTGSRLKKKNSELLIASHEKENTYRIIQTYPILIDFEHSVLSEEDLVYTRLHSAIKRNSYQKLGKYLKRLASPPKTTTARNIQEFVQQLILIEPSPTILIIGGGTIGQGLQAVYESPSVKIVAFDIYASPYIQFIADAHRIPLPDNSFDGVVVQAVLEHVLEPQTVVAEIHRVLKKNGIVYAETPFLQHVHEGAYDFTRFTESGHRYLFKNFELIKSGASAGAGTQLLWSLDFFFRSIFRSRMVGKGCKLLFFWLQYFDRFIPESYSIDAASGVYFLGRKQEFPTSPKAIIEHYKGTQK